MYNLTDAADQNTLRDSETQADMNRNVAFAQAAQQQGVALAQAQQTYQVAIVSPLLPGEGQGVRAAQALSDLTAAKTAAAETLTDANLSAAATLATAQANAADADAAVEAAGAALAGTLAGAEGETSFCVTGTESESSLPSPTGRGAGGEGISTPVLPTPPSTNLQAVDAVFAADYSGASVDSVYASLVTNFFAAHRAINSQGNGGGYVATEYTAVVAPAQINHDIVRPASPAAETEIDTGVLKYYNDLTGQYAALSSATPLVDQGEGTTSAGGQGDGGSGQGEGGTNSSPLPPGEGQDEGATVVAGSSDDNTILCTTRSGLSNEALVNVQHDASTAHNVASTSAPATSVSDTVNSTINQIPATIQGGPSTILAQRGVVLASNSSDSGDWISDEEREVWTYGSDETIYDYYMNGGHLDDLDAPASSPATPPSLAVPPSAVTPGPAPQRSTATDAQMLAALQEGFAPQGRFPTTATTQDDAIEYKFGDPSNLTEFVLFTTGYDPLTGKEDRHISRIDFQISSANPNEETRQIQHIRIDLDSLIAAQPTCWQVILAKVFRQAVAAAYAASPNARVVSSEIPRPDRGTTKVAVKVIYYPALGNDILITGSGIQSLPEVWAEPAVFGVLTALDKDFEAFVANKVALKGAPQGSPASIDFPGDSASGDKATRVVVNVPENWSSLQVAEFLLQSVCPAAKLSGTYVGWLGADVNFRYDEARKQQAAEAAAEAATIAELYVTSIAALSPGGMVVQSANDFHEARTPGGKAMAAGIGLLVFVPKEQALALLGRLLGGRTGVTAEELLAKLETMGAAERELLEKDLLSAKTPEQVEEILGKLAPSQIHHIATYFGEYGQKFEALFRQAGITGKDAKEVLDYAKNLMELAGHKGGHTEAYREYVYQYLSGKVGNKTGEAAKKALDDGLRYLRRKLTENPRFPYQ